MKSIWKKYSKKYLIKRLELFIELKDQISAIDMRLKRQSHFPPTDNDPFYHSDEWIQGYNTAKNEDNQQIKYCFEQFYEKSRKVK